MTTASAGIVRSRLIDAAMGRIPCDFIFKDVTYFDVFQAIWHQSDVAIIDGVIVATDPGLKATRQINGQGKFLTPGFIDAHVHVESSLMTPSQFEAAVLPRGTTTIICDPHELTNVKGPIAIEYFLNWADKLALDMRVMLSSCVPSSQLETNGGGAVDCQALNRFRNSARVLGLAEMMDIPGVLDQDPGVIEKLQAFSDGPIDGHAPLLKGTALSAYLAAGISSCHESTEQDEAIEKMGKGMAVWIREGSVAKDLRTLAPLMNMANSAVMGFCTDDRNPSDILKEGHIDFLLREAIKIGVPIEVAFRSASWSVARHYRLKNRGAIAPGYVADLCLLGDRETVDIAGVWKSGKPVEEIDYAEGLSDGVDESVFHQSVKAEIPDLADLQGPGGAVHIIGVKPGKIITEHLIGDASDSGVARLTVLERHGFGGKPMNGYVRGFGAGFHGAIASSVGHDSHNLIVVGTNPQDMRLGLSVLIQSGGGFAVVESGVILAHLALPVGGLMSPLSAREINRGLEALYAASRQVGCELSEPFLQLAFLSLPVIPHLKLTDKGLVDVDRFSIISVKASA